MTRNVCFEISFCMHRFPSAHFLGLGQVGHKINFLTTEYNKKKKYIDHQSLFFTRHLNYDSCPMNVQMLTNSMRKVSLLSHKKRSQVGKNHFREIVESNVIG